MFVKISAVALLVTAVQAQSLALSADQLERVERGEAVQVLQALPDSPWPRSTVYQFIEATPEQSAAVLADYPLAQSYVPKVKSSRVLRSANGETDVEYVISIPIYPDERSVSRQRVSMTGAEYHVEWHTLVDSTSKGSVTKGDATFRPMTNRRTGKAGTLMIHDQRVVPASMFARVPMVRSRAIDASRQTAEAIRKQVEHELSAEPAKLQAQVVRLHGMIVR